MRKPVRSVAIFSRRDNRRSAHWERRIRARLAERHPGVEVVESEPEALVVLGGDGTILEAARLHRRANPLIMGLNLGRVGFLASAREPRSFLAAIDALLAGQYLVVKRMTLAAEVTRSGEQVFATPVVNEVVVQNPIGLVDLEVSIESYPVQRIHGSGVLVATATGSTAFNLSAHGPIVMPDIKCLIVTELMDHDVPTPAVIVNGNRRVDVRVLDYRRRGLLSLTATGQPIDVVLIADGGSIFPLERKDVVAVRQGGRLLRFAELETNYFFRSLREKFAFE